MVGYLPGMLAVLGFDTLYHEKEKEKESRNQEKAWRAENEELFIEILWFEFLHKQISGKHFHLVA